MIDHQVIDILKSFNTEDIKQFRRFLSSPYFNRSDNVTKSFELLIKFHPNFSSKRLTKEYIGSLMFGSENYNDSTVRNLLLDLLNTLEVFLMQDNFRKSATYAFDNLLKELRDKKLTDVFQRNTEKLSLQYSELKDVDSEYYMAKHKLELNKFNFFALNQKVVEEKDIDGHFEELYSSGLYLTIHYVIEMICLYVTNVFFSIQYNRPVSTSLFEQVVETVNLRGLEKLLEKNKYSFILKIYIAMLNAFKNFNDDNAYYEYKNILKQNIDLLGKDEICFHYNNLMNFTTLKARNAGSESFETYYEESFNLHDEILKNGYYKNKKSEYLDYSTYRDILLVALRLKKINWVENFIISHSSKLHKSDRDNMMNLAYTYLYYEKGEYEKSWKYLNKIKIDYFVYKYDVKNYALKIYYDLGYYEETLQLIDNYKKFLDRNEMKSDESKNKIKNFISYLNKLIMFKFGQLPSKHFSTYRRRLEMANDTISHNWILQKYQEQAAEIRKSRIAKSA